MNTQKFKYENQNYLFIEDLDILITIKNDIVLWTLYSPTTQMVNLKEQSFEVIEHSLIDKIINANWKNFQNPSLDMIDVINENFNKNYTKEDYLN